MDPRNFFEEAKSTGAVPKDAKMTSAFQFGGANSEELAELVLAGIKTATASGFEEYEAAGEGIPVVGQYDVVLDSENQPAAVILTEDVKVVPFSSVDEEHAYREGEGDRSLLYWQIVHAKFFRKSYQKSNLIFNRNTSNVVLEKFRLVYPVSK